MITNWIASANNSSNNAPDMRTLRADRMELLIS